MDKFSLLILLGILASCGDATNSDRNSDGIDDFFIEYDNQYIYELYDNDFDGRVDESWVYDSDYVLVSARFDHDFNGILESEYIADGIYFTDIYTDSNGNLIPDIYTKQENGTTIYSERYYPLLQEGRGRIGRVEYHLGYPSDETSSFVSISEEEFAQQRGAELN